MIDPTELSQIKTLLSSDQISDPGVDSLAVLLDKNPMPELLGVLTESESANLASHASNTFLTTKIESSTLSSLLEDNAFQSLLDTTKLPDMLDLLKSNEFIKVAGTTDLGARVDPSNLFKLLEKSAALGSVANLFQGNDDLKKIAGDINLLNTQLAATSAGQVLFDNIAKPIENIFNQVSKSATEADNELLSDVVNHITLLAAPFQKLIPEDLKGIIDLGFGFKNATGGPAASGTFLQYGSSQSPAAGTTSTDTTGYTNLENTLNKTLSQNWKTKNSEPGNPLILEAYAYSGKNYKKDGQTGEFVWNAAFVNWVLAKSGLDFIKTMSPMAYATYGNPIEFGTFKKVRKYDIVVMSSAHGLGHIGFVWAYDNKTNLVTVLGGNQAGTVKLTKIPLSRSDPALYMSHIRRNWKIPADKDVPLFQTTLPTRPGQQTSGAAASRDTRAGGTGAASGGTLV